MNPAPRMSALFWILLLALGSLASTGCARQPQPPDAARKAAPRPGGTYPAARHGGGYMFNYYFPPAPSATPWAARLVCRRQADRRRPPWLHLAD